MITGSFEVYNPLDLNDALTKISQPGAVAIAGGTDLIVKAKDGLSNYQTLVNLKNLPELKGIQVINDRLHIFSGTTHQELAKSLLIEKNAPIISKAAQAVGSWQIRNSGTIGGNVQNASPAADLIGPLMVLQADCHLISQYSSERIIPINDYFSAPGKTNAASSEILKSLSFKIPQPNTTKWYFEKIGARKALACAKVSLSAMFGYQPEDQTIVDCRIAAAAVGPTVIRLNSLEELLKGERVTPELISESRQLAAELISPISDIRSTAEYRLEVSLVLIKRCLESLL